jgi:polyisoprenyl-teichoic acid--peptidoglycan teichoic acid transferase
MLNQNSKSSTTDLILTVMLVVFIVAGLIGAWTLYQNTRTFVATSQLPIFPRADGNAAALPTPDRVVATSTQAPEATPDSEESESPTEPVAVATGTPKPAAVPQLDEPLTILLMGIDLRPQEADIPRTDSMILLRLDPASGEVGMLSFPRDLYITIPNYGDGEYLDRINMPYRLGELYDYPGGGPALAKQAIRRNFGIQVDRYVTMDFNGFRRVIDEIGGIEIDVPEELVDYDYPTEDFGTMTVRFEEGTQVMDGERALIYARTRKSSSDFARAERQQQVILAVRDKVLSLDIIPSLTPARIANLAATVNESVATDLSVDEVFALVQAVQNVETRDINRAVIDSSLIIEYRTYAGAEVLLPRWNQVLPLVEETFGVELLPIAPTPTPPPPPPTATPTPQFVPDYSGTVAVQNASSFDGVEGAVQSTLLNEGYNVIGASLATERGRTDTVILIGNPDALGTAETIARRFGLGMNSIQYAIGGGADVILVIGDNLATFFADSVVEPETTTPEVIPTVVPEVTATVAPQ